MDSEVEGEMHRAVRVGREGQGSFRTKTRPNAEGAPCCLKGAETLFQVCEVGLLAWGVDTCSG